MPFSDGLPLMETVDGFLVLTKSTETIRRRPEANKLMTSSPSFRVLIMARC